MRTMLGLALGVAALAAPAQVQAAGSGGVGDGTRGGGYTTTTPGTKAKLEGGFAVAPADAPRRVVRAIEAANRIVKGKPYCMGGGHSSWESRCYDCSGTVSYALGDRGARVLDSPMPSGSFMRWGARGLGKWITIYANGGHMYAVIAGLRLDTSQTAGEGPGWSATKLRQSGFSVRHPRGL
jgi:hypothetical protein